MAVGHWRDGPDANQQSSGVSSRSPSSGFPFPLSGSASAGPGQAQTSWRREAFPLSVRKHRSSATSSLQEARLKHSPLPPPHTPTPPQKMQEEQPDSRICQKPLNSFYRAKKEKKEKSREQRVARVEELWRQRQRRGEHWVRVCKKVRRGTWNFIFLFIFLHRLTKRSASAR